MTGSPVRNVAGDGGVSQSLPLHLGAAAFCPHTGVSAVELFGACSNRDISEQESKPVLCLLKPPAHTGGGTAPFLCVRYSPAMCPHCALPSLSLSPPHSCSTQLLSLHHAQLLSCQTLGWQGGQQLLKPCGDFCWSQRSLCPCFCATGWVP